MAPLLRVTVLTLSLLSLLTIPSFSQPITTTKCKSQVFKDKTFENCNDLPTLDASLHWTYEEATSSLSMAYTAPPPKPEGWVAWALNPQGSGMVGSQALFAFKPTADGPVKVDTADIQSYHAVNRGPISYNVTDLSGEQSADGKITLFATWPIPSGESIVNTVWQVGPILGGKPSKHNFDQANLSSRMKLSLAAGGAATSTAEAPEPAYEALGPAAMKARANAGGRVEVMVVVLGLAALVASLF